MFSAHKIPQWIIVPLLRFPNPNLNPNPNAKTQTPDSELWSLGPAFHLLCNSLQCTFRCHGFLVFAFEFDSWFYVSLFMIRWPFFFIFQLASSYPLFYYLFFWTSRKKEFRLSSSHWVFSLAAWMNGWMKLIKLWITYVRGWESAWRRYWNMSRMHWKIKISRGNQVILLGPLKSW